MEKLATSLGCSQTQFFSQFHHLNGIVYFDFISCNWHNQPLHKTIWSYVLCSQSEAFRAVDLLQFSLTSNWLKLHCFLYWVDSQVQAHSFLYKTYSCEIDLQSYPGWNTKGIYSATQYSYSSLSPWISMGWDISKLCIGSPCLAPITTLDWSPWTQPFRKQYQHLCVEFLGGVGGLHQRASLGIVPFLSQPMTDGHRHTYSLTH